MQEPKVTKQTIKQRGGEDPDIEVTITAYPPRGLPAPKRPFTQTDFETLLGEVTRPIESEESDEGSESP